MLEIVFNAIQQYYKEKNYKLFKSLCKRNLTLWKDLKDYIELQGFTLVEENDDIDPSQNWYIHFNLYKKANFEISYNTSLHVSKLAPIFNVGHCFEVENKDKNKVAPDLGNCSDQPYTKSQLRLHEKIAACLTGRGYVELRDVDLDEAVEGFKMPGDIVSLGHGMPIFGHNVTVELLLFRDIYNILGDDD